MEVVWEIRDRKPETDWELFVATTWGLWNQRNTIRHGGQRKTAHKLTRDMEEFLREFCHKNPLPCKLSRPFTPPRHLPNRAGIKPLWTGLLVRRGAVVVLVL